MLLMFSVGCGRQRVLSWVQDRFEHGHPLILTPEEKRYLAEKEQIVLGVDSARAPLEFIDSSGRYSGLSADYIKECAKRLKLKLVVVPGLNTATAMTKAMAGEIDVIPKVMPNSERAKDVLFTQVYITFPTVIVTRKDAPPINDLDDLKDLHLGVVRGLISEEMFVRENPTQPLIRLADVREALLQLTMGHIDAYAGNLGVVSYAIDQGGFSNLKIAATLPYNQDVAFAVRADAPLLRSALGKVLDSLTSQERQKIKARWITLPYQRKADWKTLAPYGLVVLLGAAAVLVRVRRLGRTVRERAKVQYILQKHAQYLEAEVDRRTQEITAIQDVTIMALASLAETRDDDTGNHIRRTQRFVFLLGRHLAHHPRFRGQLDDVTLRLLFKTAPLHDIGKVGIPDRILLKPGRLDPIEFELMKTHTTLGRDALEHAELDLGSSAAFLSCAKEIAYSHHEKWDGSGYPLGLRGDAIPLVARLMAVADVYDALTSRRKYKKRLPHQEAVEIIREGRGSHFDPDVVDAFLELEEEFCAMAARYVDSDKDLDQKQEHVEQTLCGI